jgi:hypothetical protein
LVTEPSVEAATRAENVVIDGVTVVPKGTPVVNELPQSE